MKIILITLSIIGLGSSAFYLTYKQPPTVELAVLKDVTDPMIAQPQAQEILSLYDLSGDGKWGGAGFRFSDLTDVSYNHVSEAHLGSQNQWLSNEFSRDKEIKAFNDSVTAIVNDHSESIGRDHSSIYIPMAIELNLLSVSTAQKRFLFIYSDLIDNDLYFSLYSKEQLHSIQIHPEAVAKALEAKETLSNLTGIQVYFIYQPASVEQDTSFRIISGFYGNLLESKGAIVHIVPNFFN